MSNHSQSSTSSVNTSKQHNPPIAQPTRIFNIYHPNNSLANLLILPSTPAPLNYTNTLTQTQSPIYYAQMSIYKRHTPSIQLFAISPSASHAHSAHLTDLRATINAKQVKDSGQRVGTAWMQKVKWTHRVRMCAGDPERIQRLDSGGGGRWWQIWDKRPHLHGEYVLSREVDETGDGMKFVNDFESPYRSDFDVKDSARQPRSEACPSSKSKLLSCQLEQTGLRWLRTRSKADGLESKWLSRTMSVANFKLVTAEGRIIALFESNGVKSFRKKGKLKIYDLDGIKGNDGKGGVEKVEDRSGLHGVEGVDLDEVMVVLGYCVIQEKMRRGV